MLDLLVTSATLPDGRSGMSVAVRDGAIVEVAPGARATLILQNSGPAHLSENVEFLLGAGSDLTVVSVQEWDDDALHVAVHFAELAENARIKHVAVTLGGGVVRLNPSAHLAGARSDAELLGAYFADATQHLEQQVYVHHDGPETRSRPLQAPLPLRRMLRSRLQARAQRRLQRRSCRSRCCR